MSIGDGQRVRSRGCRAHPPGSEPDVIADAYWRLHVERTQSELFYNDLGEFEGLSDRYSVSG